MIASLLVFAGTGLLFAMIPGPDFALILRTALTRGRKASVYASSGIACGLVVHTTLSVAGLTAVIAHSPFLFKCITWAGAAYLAWIGLCALFSRPGSAAAGPEAAKAEKARAATRAAARGAFMQGFLTNVLNPKAVIFFLTFLPQFVVPGAGVAVPMQLLVLGAVMIIIAGAWFITLSLLLSRLASWFQSETFRRRLERVTGVIFLGFSVRLLATSS